MALARIAAADEQNHGAAHLGDVVLHFHDVHGAVGDRGVTLEGAARLVEAVIAGAADGDEKRQDPGKKPAMTLVRILKSATQWPRVCETDMVITVILLKSIKKEPPGRCGGGIARDSMGGDLPGRQARRLSNSK